MGEVDRPEGVEGHAAEAGEGPAARPAGGAPARRKPRSKASRAVTPRPAGARPPAPDIDEPTVPAWCSQMMEAGVWVAILAAALGVGVLPLRIITLVCAAPLAVAALAWGLEWYYLRRPCLVISWGLALFVVPLVGVFVWGSIHPADGVPSAGLTAHLTALGLCLLVFVIVSGGFTETQVSRLLAFLGVLGIAEVGVGLRLLSPEAGSLPIYGRLASEPGMVASLGSEWAAGALVLCSCLASATFAARSFARSAIEPGNPVFRSPVTWLASPGTSLGFMAVAAVVLMLVLLFLAQSLVLFGIAIVSLMLFLLVLGLARRLGLWLTVGGVVACAVLWLANLGRPDGAKFRFSGEALQANVAALLSGEDRRVVEAPAPPNGPDATSRDAAFPAGTEAGTMSTVRSGTSPPNEKTNTPPLQWGGRGGPAPFSARRISFEAGDLHQAGRRGVWLVTPLLVGLIVYLLASALGGVVRFHELQRILSAGAFAAVFGVSLLAALGNCLSNLAVGLVAAAMGAIAAASGDFEEELEEE